MKKPILFCLLLLSTTACSANLSTSSPAVQVVETTQFSQVAALTEQKVAKYARDQVLIVVDIDNTLLTSASDLGGDIWYQWQREQLTVKPSAEQKVKCLFEDNIALLYELSPMQLTESDVAAYVKAWQSQGITLFALTSRSPKTRAATVRELTRAGLDMSKTALGKVGQSVPLLEDNIPREMSYSQGIMMTSGMNKGEMLRYILNKTQRQFKAIIFVDDSQKNVDNLAAEFSQKPATDMTIFHYTKIENDRIKVQGSVLTQQQADLMAKQWDTLSQTLNSIFPARNTSACLAQ